MEESVIVFESCLNPDLAQLVELLVYTQEVGGSSPSVRTTGSFSGETNLLLRVIAEPVRRAVQ